MYATAIKSAALVILMTGFRDIEREWRSRLGSKDFLSSKNSSLAHGQPINPLGAAVITDQKRMSPDYALSGN